MMQRFLRYALAVASATVCACSEVPATPEDERDPLPVDDGEGESGEGEGEPGEGEGEPDACAALADGDVCDDGDRCTLADRCRDGRCDGARRTRESFSCDGDDEDCDGVIDEDCRLRISGGFVDRVGPQATGPDGTSLRPAGAALGVTGISSNTLFTLKSRTRQGETR